MAIIQVPHTVRVWAFVDTDTEKVVKVIEDLESIEDDTSSLMLDENYDPIPWDQRAAEIAADNDWPAWDR